MANSGRDDPGTAPQPDRWYNLMLGPSFDHDSANKYSTLRYVSKPASIDKSKSGVMHKNKDGRVSVEFQNNQLGKPKVSFEGSSEHYKENDAVLFFDGETFRLERLHRAVKQLRHLRVPGESAAASASAAVQSVPTTDPRLSPVGKVARPVHVPRSTFPPVPVEVERIDIAEPQITGLKPGITGVASHPTDRQGGSLPSPSQGTRNHEGEENQEIDIEDLFGSASPDVVNQPEEEDVGIGSDDVDPRQNYYDDEIADVDDSGDEGNKGPNAADALRAQLNASDPKSDRHTSSSGSSSGSESGTGSSSSSGDSEGSDDDSVNSI